MKTKKPIATGMLVLGIVSVLLALYLDITDLQLTYNLTAKLSFSINGALLILGALLVIAGVYSFPSKNHRKIINVLFLFPLIFSFAVTVLVPFAFGIFYSMTDWNGIDFNNFVGSSNYVTMFKSTDYLYSLLITVIFTVVNMILVNFAAFALALLCTSKVKGKNFYQAALLVVSYLVMCGNLFSTKYLQR